MRKVRRVKLTGRVWLENGEKHLRKHNPVNLEVDRLQKNMATMGSTTVSQEQYSEATQGAGSHKLAQDNLFQYSTVQFLLTILPLTGCFLFFHTIQYKF